MKKHSKAPALTGAALAISLVFSAEAGAQQRPDWMQRRLDMIEALEVTQDDARLEQLVREDAGLSEYARVLIRAASHKEDPALVRKLLDLPVLDKQSAAYAEAVGGVFSYFAGNGIETKPEIMALLLDGFKHDRGAVNKALNFIFEMAARPFFPPDVEAAKLLVAHGADPEGAAQAAENLLRTTSQPGAEKWLQERLEDIRRFKRAVSGHSQPAPAPTL